VDNTGTKTLNKEQQVNLYHLLYEVHEQMYKMMEWCEKLQPIKINNNGEVLTYEDLNPEDYKNKEIMKTRLFRELDGKLEQDQVWEDQTSRSILKDLRKVIKGLEEEMELCD
jgi:homogentisate 1,2-dioxygenase